MWGSVVLYSIVWGSVVLHSIVWGSVVLYVVLCGLRQRLKGQYSTVQ